MKYLSLHNDKKINSQKGFTILELLIATSVFSVVLLLCATAIVQVGRMFYKGTVINRVQNSSRGLVDDVTQAIQFGAGSTNFYVSTPNASTVNGVSISVRCIGDIRYSYASAGVSQGTGPGQIPHVLWKDKVDDARCEPRNITATNPGGINGQDMMGDNMRVVKFEVTESGALWGVKLIVAYGPDDDVFDKTSGTVNYSLCTGSQTGGQFCAVSDITTNVTRRL